MTYLQFVVKGKKVLDSAKETFAVWSEKLGTAKEGLNKLFSGLMATARADGREKAQADIQSEMDAMQKGAGAQDELLTPEHVSKDIDPLAPEDGSGIIEAGEDIREETISTTSAESTGRTIKFSEMTPEEALMIAQDYRIKAPIEIPGNATIKPTSKVGYEQITYNWRDGAYKYEVRWHTRTPGAPVDQGNTWVISRKTIGSGGVGPMSEILSGNQWISRYAWQKAIEAYQIGTATQYQLKILEQGHWKEQGYDR